MTCIVTTHYETARLILGCPRFWRMVERRRIRPVMRTLERATDPLFRRAGIDLDEG